MAVGILTPGRQSSQAEADKANLVTHWVGRRAANTWTLEVCSEVAQACTRAYGAQGVDDSSPLQRSLRDIQTVAQHAAFAVASPTRNGASMTQHEVVPGLQLTVG